jgi:hypothetical protein
MSMFTCRPIGGELRPDGDEVLEVKYFPPDEALRPTSAWHARTPPLASERRVDPTRRWRP